MGKQAARSLSENGKRFNKMLEYFMYRQDVNQVFETLLDMFICAFSFEPEYTKNRDDSVKRFSDQEKKLLNEIFYEILRMQKEAIVDQGKPWNDIFGEMYEFITGNGKKSGLGQFFTPGHICDMMVKMITDKENSGKNILEPCCGSGRFILASHAHNPMNFHYACDLDLICCKMTVVNMIIHGCKGEVVWKDALDPTSFRHGWLINMRGIGVNKLDRKDSFIAKNDKDFFFKNRNQKGQPNVLNF